MQRQHWYVIACTAGIAGFGLGCDDASGPALAPITEEQAQHAGQAISDQVEDLAHAFVLGSRREFVVQKATDVLGRGGYRMRVLAASGLGVDWAGDECISSTDSTDTDGDGVPDDLTVTFHCTGVDSFFGTYTVSGSYRVTDPGTPAGFCVTYSNLRSQLDTFTGNYFDVQMNGSDRVTAAATTASLNEDLAIDVVERIGNVTNAFTVSQTWQASYAAAPGQFFSPVHPLPAGETTVSGSSTWKSGARSYAFTLSTAEPLTHEVCLHPVQMTSGVVNALVVGEGGTLVRIQYRECRLGPVFTLLRPPSP